MKIKKKKKNFWGGGGGGGGRIGGHDTTKLQCHVYKEWKLL